MCSNKRSYLIIEGLNNFGLELIDFLIVRGARNIIVATSKKNNRRFCNYRLDLWRGYGVNVVLRDDFDFSQKQNAKTLLKEALLLGQLDAIFDLQRIDSLPQRFSNSKDLFTKFVDEESRDLCSHLQKFIVCSTVTNVEESLNDLLLKESEMAKLCERKSKENTSGLLILWGPIEKISESRKFQDEKIAAMTIPRALEQLDNIIGSNLPIVGVFYKPLIKESVQVKRLLFLFI